MDVLNKKRIRYIFALITLFASVMGLISLSSKETAQLVDIVQEPLSEPTETSSPEQNELYTVTQVIDGDTLKVRNRDSELTIRLIGIDTPETVDPRKPVQCFGKEASDKAKELLLNKKVRLEGDPSQGEKDKYGRLLQYLFLEDETFFNKKMIEEGYAHEYTYENNPYTYQEDFLEAQQKARENKRGLWSDETCKGITSSNNSKKVLPSPIELKKEY